MSDCIFDSCCYFVAENLINKLHCMKYILEIQLDIYLTHSFIHAEILPMCPWIDRQGYFLSECIYYIYLLFTEITCTDMSLNLTEAINVMKISHSYNYLEMVTMSCQTGYIGTHVTSQCIDVNTWSQKPPICTSKILLSAIYTPNQ